MHEGARAAASVSVAYTRHLVQVGAGAQADPPQLPADELAGIEQAGGREERQHELRAGQRGGSQQQAHLAPEAAAVDQYEPLAALRKLVGELHRDAPTERVPHELARSWPSVTIRSRIALACAPSE